MPSQPSIVCDECEETDNDMRICIDCVQTLCSNCDKKIHNKGNRIKHQRVLHNGLVYEDTEFQVTYFAEQCYWSKSLEFQTQNQSLVRFVYEFLLDEARKGNLAVPLECILKHLQNKQQISLLNLNHFLIQEQMKNLFIQTIRWFGDFPEQIYFSIKQDSFSIESLSWILKSISGDKMKPTEQLVQSRFKEYFGFHIRNKWRNYLAAFSDSPQRLSKMNKYKKNFGQIEIYQDEKTESHIFILSSVDQTYEDTMTFEPEDSLYLEFQSFIQDFFSINKSQETINEEKIKKWLSSVENQQTKNHHSLNEVALLKILQNQNIDWAIPGGKYGAALMLKNCGNEILQSQSLGKLVALVSQALKNELLIHIKTFIVLCSKNSNELSQDKFETLQKFKEQILEILYQSPDSTMTLAQLPSAIQEKYGGIPDLPAFGYPKLKNYLQTLEDVVTLQVINKNHIKVKLRNKFKYFINIKLKQNLKKLNQIPKKEIIPTSQELYKEELQHIIKWEGYKTLKQNEFDEKCKEIERLGIGSQIEHWKSCSTLQDYLNNIKLFIVSTLKKNTFGIPIEDLEQKLNEYLECPMDYKIFKSESLEDFLFQYMDECVEILLQKPSFIRKELKKRLVKMVFPKKLIKHNPNNKVPVSDGVQQSQTLPNVNTNNISEYFSQNSFSDLSKMKWEFQSISDLSVPTLSQNFLNKHKYHYNNKKNKQLAEDQQLYQAFECQVISPINSFHTHKEIIMDYMECNSESGSEDNNEQSPCKETAHVNSSVNFVQMLIDEDDMSQKSCQSNFSNWN